MTFSRIETTFGLLETKWMSTPVSPGNGGIPGADAPIARKTTWVVFCASSTFGVFHVTVVPTITRPTADV